MKKQPILVPIENSLASRQAIACAIGLAQSAPSEVYLLRVGSKKEYGHLDTAFSVVPPKASQFVDVLTDIRDMLTEVLIDISKHRELDLERLGTVHRRFTVGDPEGVVLKVAEEIGCRAIVMGVTTDKDPDFSEKKFQFTSEVAGKIVKRAPCAVFTLKGPDHFSAL